ncbi:sigma-70 family RNA polymerase sigma factor [Thalassoglobus sp. JC818]|uniref:RNA polymerase sigma factor n=1 Tax=Thalassoglobus sp. JC818 TaxID=3232136 RepID=UPI00345A421D
MAEKIAATQSSDTQDLFWIRLLEENENWIRGVLRNRLHSTEEVDDVFQEVSVAVSRRDLRPSDLTKARSWLYRVAIRQVLQYRRKSGRYRRLVENNQALTPRSNFAVEDDPLAFLVRTERAEVLRQALADLGELDREILHLKYVENWTYQDLSENLGVSKNTIEHRLVRSKKRLRSLLAQYSEEDV